MERQQGSSYNTMTADGHFSEAYTLKNGNSLGKDIVNEVKSCFDEVIFLRKLYTYYCRQNSFHLKNISPFYEPMRLRQQTLRSYFPSPSWVTKIIFTCPFGKKALEGLELIDKRYCHFCTNSVCTIFFMLYCAQEFTSPTESKHH